MKSPFALPRPLTTAEQATVEKLYNEITRRRMHDAHAYIWHQIALHVIATGPDPRIAGHIAAHGPAWTLDPRERARVLEHLKACGLTRYKFDRQSGDLEGQRHRQLEYLEYLNRRAIDRLKAAGKLEKALELELELELEPARPLQQYNDEIHTPDIDHDDDPDPAAEVAATAARTAELWARLDAHPGGRELFAAFVAAERDPAVMAKELGCTTRTVFRRLTALRNGRRPTECGKHAGPRGRYSREHLAEAARRGLSPRELYLQCGRL